MFDFFRKKTGTDALVRLLKESYVSAVKTADREYGIQMSGLMGPALMDKAEAHWKSKVKELSASYKVPESEVRSLIESTSKAVYDKYFERNY